MKSTTYTKLGSELLRDTLMWSKETGLQYIQMAASPPQTPGNDLLRDGLVLVRIPRSQRKRDKFIAALGRAPGYLYSFHFDGNFTWVDEAEFERVRGKCTRARVDVTKLLKCWNG